MFEENIKFFFSENENKEEPKNQEPKNQELQNNNLTKLLSEKNKGDEDAVNIVNYNINYTMKYTILNIILSSSKKKVLFFKFFNFIKSWSLNSKRMVKVAL